MDAGTSSGTDSAMGSDQRCQSDFDSSTMDATENEQADEHRSNPFDAHLLETLHHPTFTPSIFARVVSPTTSYTDSPVSRPAASRSRSKRTRRFRWSIDHIAALNPAQIDEEELALQEACQRYDEETEARIQAAIDKFFSQPIIAPSPWKSATPDSKSCDPVVMESSWKESPRKFDDPPADHQTPGTDLEQSFPNAKARVDEDINSSVYLLSNSESEDEGSPLSRKKPNLFGVDFNKSHRTSMGIDKFSSPEISPIKHASPTQDISPVVYKENCMDESEILDEFDAAEDVLQP